MLLSTTCPSNRLIILFAIIASCCEWVTITMVVPSAFSCERSSITASPLFESRLPVGSKLKEKERTKYRRGRIGFVFQSFNLIDELTVEENVDLQLRYIGVPAKERRERVTEILRKVGLSQRAKHYPQQLSGGQQQRVAIARAVVGKPSIILADEPTGNLDSKNGMEVMQLLSELNEEGTTIVMVTHSKHDATYASRIINLFDGQVVDAMNDQL